MLRTRICDLLGISYPILQGGMAWVATAELAAAVSNGGGLGQIGAGNMPPDVLRREIRRARQLTDRPFGVNVMLLSPFVDELMRVVAEERVPVVTTGAGNPGKYMAMLKESGARIIPVVPVVALARRLERLGVDALIVEGTEAGGHIGELTTMVLTPQVVDAVKIPVIAAGGIADGRAVAAALALGASGVQVGTRFICASECTVHPNYKEAVLRAGDRDTSVTGRSTGHPVRALTNKLTRRFDQLERQGAPAAELEALGSGRLAAAAREGDVEFGSLMAGQSAAMVNRIEPARQIILDLVDVAAGTLEHLGDLVREGKGR